MGKKNREKVSNFLHCDNFHFNCVRYDMFSHQKWDP